MALLISTLSHQRGVADAERSAAKRLFLVMSGDSLDGSESPVYYEWLPTHQTSDLLCEFIPYISL
jgi:hypothetical protein